MGSFLEKLALTGGIFQGDSLSPLLFVVCMIPLTKILRKIKAGYVIKDGNLKVNHLLFMDDLKLFGRPISVLPVISKIIEKIIYRQLITFLDKNHLLTKFQFGFRPKLSTEYAATILLDSIRNNVDKGKLVGAIFVDLAKAFDTVSHAMLLDKLPLYGVGGRELEWFKDYLFFRKAKVAYNSCFSKENALLTGVPQRSILGPLLFLILFNDAVDVIEHSSILKYADDTVLYVADQDIQSIKAK